MNVLKRLIKRVHFRKTIKKDESVNVVDGMVRARKLYKELSIMTHPDRHSSNKEIAQEFMQRITANKHNYAVLLSLKSEIEEKLK